MPPSAIALPSERSFGLFLGALFALMGLWFLYFGSQFWASICYLTGSVVVLIAISAPGLLAVPNRAWFRLGVLLNAIVSPFVLGAIFFLLITPIAVVMRLFGRDVLNRRYDEALPTYWMDRTPPGPKPESFKNQF